MNFGVNRSMATPVIIIAAPHSDASSAMQFGRCGTTKMDSPMQSSQMRWSANKSCSMTPDGGTRLNTLA